MVDAIIGAATFFVLLAINKAIVEPLATSAGRKLLDRHLGSACALLDDQLEKFGLDFNPEEAIRDYLDLENDADMTEEDREKIIAEVFKAWDLRQAAHFKS